MTLVQIVRTLASAGVWLALFVGCASANPPARLTGTLELIPPVGAPVAANGGSYGSHRYRDATPVDYSRPGFAVVYLEDGEPPSDLARFSIRESAAGVRLRPRYGVAGLSGVIEISNETKGPQVVSCPEASVLESVEPGASIRIVPVGPGRHSLYLPASPVGASIAFVSPGPFDRVSSLGRWALPGTPAGRWTLKTWHPRFPSFERVVEVDGDGETTVDLKIGTRAAVGEVR